MKKLRPKKSAAAFTLIELLVVIAIIGILAGLVVGLGGLVSGKGKIGRVQAELAQLKTAIENYKGKRGHYPPDNPTDPLIQPNASQMNALYYELVGVTNDIAAGKFGTLDGVEYVSTNVFLTLGLGVDGIANSSLTSQQSDDAAAAESFLKNVKPTQYVSFTNGSGDIIKLLNVPVQGTDRSVTNLWHYNSHNPTNNSGSYDLWAEVLIGHKTNIIGNWSDNPIVK